MDFCIETSWKKQLEGEFDKPYFQKLTRFLSSEYEHEVVFPPAKEVFNAFELCPFDKTKVVILGQDPYHDYGQAHGLCFSVNDGVALPPSLLNIFKEIELDLGKAIPQSGNLARWAKQGVLLLNASLTVRAHSPASHQNRGWEQFTDAVIRALLAKQENLVFLLWGASAQKKGAFIDSNRNLMLKSVHPSPLSAYRGFFGNKHFSLANEYLNANGISEIEW